ncbi:MAG: polymerase delta subunit, partial [Marmoricola sp.]|nr:polymerase delta subunit [Marmoricola sp.]
SMEMVKKYFGGRAEAKSFAVADLTLHGQTAKALEELRWALDGGMAAVLVTSAMAGGLRSLARYMAAPPGMRNNDLMREVGVPAWKLDTLRRQSHGWDDEGVGRAIRSVARADADVKGQASDPSYALERMVLEVARARPVR